MSKKFRVVLALLVFCMLLSGFSNCYARPLTSSERSLVRGAFSSLRELVRGAGNGGGYGGGKEKEEEYNPCKWGCNVDETAGKKVTDFESEYSCYRDNPGVFGTPFYN